MSTRPSGWIARTAMALIWFVLTVAIAGAVVRYEATLHTSDVEPLTVPQITTADRQTVTLEQQTIQPMLSGDGTVVQDADGRSWNIEAPVTPQAQAYQLLQAPVGVKALIVGGPAGFDCPWLGLGQGPDGGVTMRCRIPADIPVVAGLRGTMVLQLTAPVETMALPVTAVLGSAEQGQVVVVNPDGTTNVRDVGLGIADTFNVEITSGLEPGKQVLAAPIQSDFARPSS